MNLSGDIRQLVALTAMDIRARSAIDQSFFSAAAYDGTDCNLCGRDDFLVLAERDALNLSVRTVMCRSCGLIAINPRLSKEWYGRYYASVGGVRRVYKHGQGAVEMRLGAGFERARRHGRALAERLHTFIRPELTIDVGSAEGGLLAGLREVIPIEPLGIEPTVSRAEFATARGIPTHAALIEDISSVLPDMPLAGNIFCTKSLNHFLDPAFFFRWAWTTLSSDGRIILEVKNFRQQARMSGRIRYAIQIDHPFMFVPQTLRQFVEAAGFEILFFEVDEEKNSQERVAQRASGLPIGHIRLAAKKTSRAPFSEPVLPKPTLVYRLKRQLSPAHLYFTYLTRYAHPFKNFMMRVGSNV